MSIMERRVLPVLTYGLECFEVLQRTIKRLNSTCWQMLLIMAGVRRCADEDGAVFGRRRWELLQHKGRPHGLGDGGVTRTCLDAGLGWGTLLGEARGHGMRNWCGTADTQK